MKIKRILALVLVVALSVCFVGCGSDKTSKSRNNTTSRGSSSTADEVYDDAAGEESVDTEYIEVVDAEIDLEGVTTIGDVAEIEIVHSFVTTDVKPPKIESSYSHYEAEVGKFYIVVVMDVKNIGPVAVDIEDIFEATLQIGGLYYNKTTAVLKDDGTSLEGGYTKIDPLAKERVYQMFEVSKYTETNNLKLIVTSGQSTYSTEFSVAYFESKVKEVKPSSVITDDETLNVKIESVGFSPSLYPRDTSGYYTYYEAESGKVYLIVKMTVKNLKGTDMKYSSIAGVSCVYLDKYHYSFTTVFEDDGGKSLSGYANLYSLAPLDTGVVYYLAEVPAAVETTGNVDITFYIAGNYYIYRI